MPPKQSAKPQRAQKSHSLDRTQDLATAASSGIISRVRRLLQGSNPKWRDASTGKTPLHFAIERRHFLIAKLLIKRKNIEVDIKDNMDRTPLCYAARVGSLDIFQLLLVKGAILDAPDKFGKTPASYAVESCRQDQGLQILQLLLDRRVKLDVADKKGQSPLFYAAQCGETHVVEFLLKHDSKPDRRDELGRTPLSYAAQDGSLGVVKALLTLNNVDIASRDNTDRTPLIYA
ncbi:ankyrin repeat-containing domain protein, partial [Hyaloscypha sp. PMI_1271]